MDDYLPKPFRADELYNAVENLDSTLTIGTSNMEEQQEPTLDQEIALQTTGGDRDLAKVLLETCLEETPNILADAKTAVSEGRWSDARRCGHSMKSGFGAIGAMAASRLAKDLEFIETDVEETFSCAISAIEDEMKKLKNFASEL